MRQITCGMIQDLLISYCDGLTAENVAELVEGHLEECQTCRHAYEKMLQKRKETEQEEFVRGRKFGRKLKNLRFYLIGAVIGIVMPFAVLVLWYLLASIRSYIEIMFFSYFW